jgi:hypothetical protein
MATLTPIITGTPGQPPSYNVGMAETFSWVPVENDANRPLFARAGYITNFEDFAISISAAELNISSIEIKDGNSNRVADVESVGGFNSLRVATQNLSSNVDTVSLADKLGSNVTVTSATSSLNVNVTNQISITNQPSAVFVTYADNFQTDAFGRLRVSQPSTLFDSKQLYGKAPQFYNEVINGTASITFSAFDSCTHLKTFASGDYAINQTRVRFNYAPGKSLCYMFTGLFNPEPNVIKRIGCFQSLSAAPYEPSDGMFLEVTENGPVFRSIKTQGSYHTQYIPQSAWNVDKMDGTGPSGYTLNLSAVNLFVIDYEWLGVGRVRYGFYQNGRLYYCHHDDHAENNLQGPYISYPNQPVRYEIRQTGAGSGTLKQICATVLSEGGEDDVGTLITAAVSGTGVTVTSTAGQWSPILAVRSAPGAANQTNTIRNIELLNNTSRNLVYQLVLNSTITPALSWQNVDSNTVQQALGGTGFTVANVGHVMATNYVAPAGKGGFNQTDINRALARLGTAIDGTPDTLVIIGRFLDNTGSTSDVYAAMNLLIRG